MGYATGVAVGPDGLIYVAADWDGVKVFAANADGDVAPVKSLSGRATRVAFDASGRLYVVDNSANEIRAYEAGFADGASPIKTLTGGSSGLSSPTDLAFDSSGRMYVANASPSSVRVFSTSHQTISFLAIADTTLAASPVTPSASASSSEAVTFTTTTPGVCTSGGGKRRQHLARGDRHLHCPGISGRQCNLEPGHPGRSILRHHGRPRWRFIWRWLYCCTGTRTGGT